MEELKTSELKKVDGGISLGITELFLLATGVPFVVGVIDGFLSPIYVNS